jgi:hypothetical protein
MTGEEYEKRLLQTFAEGGVPYKRAYDLHEAEGKYGQHVLKLSGYLARSDAFKCVFFEACELLNTHCRPQVKTPLSEFYNLFMPRLTNAFHSVCGAERAAIHGYPLPAYTILRNVYDNNVLTSAALQRITTFYAIMGLDPSRDFDPGQARKNRKKEEQLVRGKMTGNNSGLSQETIDELREWDDLFDAEVHGGHLSLADSIGYMKGTAPLPILPKWTEMSFAMFMNRHAEVCWTIHRLLPQIQPPGIRLPNSWAEKWKVVDESHELTVRALSKDLNMKIGDAFAEFLHAKFPFNANTTFTL